MRKKYRFFKDGFLLMLLLTIALLAGICWLTYSFCQDDVSYIHISSEANL